MKKIYYLLLAYVMLTQTFIACQSDMLPGAHPEHNAGGLILEAVLPVYKQPATRTVYPITSLQETKIHTMQALIFTADNDVFRGYQTINVSEITFSGTNKEKIRFNLESFSDTHPAIASQDIYLHLVVNVPLSLISALNTDVDSYNAVKAKLESSWTNRPENPNTWNGLPMWGKSDVFLSSSFSHLPTIYLLRSLAKVEVSVESNSIFTLTNIHLCNINKLEKYRIIPDESKLNMADNKVTGTTLPNYTPQEKNDIKDVAYTNVINPTVFYLPENEAFTASLGSAEWKKHLCLVLEGTYKEGNSTPKTVFYRIDFKDIKGTYLPVLRNHVYSVKVGVPLYPGDETLEKAKENASFVVESYVICKDLNEILHIENVGEYMLGVNRLEFHRGYRDHEDKDGRHTITIEDDTRLPAEKEEKPRTFLKVEFLKPSTALASETWNFEFQDEKGTKVNYGWIKEAVKEKSSVTGEEGIKIVLEPYEPMNPGSILNPGSIKEPRTVYLKVYALGGMLSHRIKIVQYNQDFFVHYKHPKQNKYWLVNHAPGTGLVIQAATPWRAKMRSDSENLVKEICTTEGDITGRKDLFFIRFINGWNGTEDGQKRAIKYKDTGYTVKFRLQSILDPGFWRDYELGLFGLMERNGYYITASSPMSPHFKHDIHGHFMANNLSWYYAQNRYQYDKNNPSKMGTLITAEAEKTGCPGLENPPGGGGWFLPTGEEIKKVLEEVWNNPTEPLDDYYDKMLNFWQTNLEMERESAYLSIPHWESDYRHYSNQFAFPFQTSLSNYNGGSMYWTNDERGNGAYCASIFLHPERYEPGKPELTAVYPWRPSGLAESKSSLIDGFVSGREYFCISKIN